MAYQLIHGSAHSLPEIADKSVHLICTSPPFFGLRQYSGDQNILWPTVEYSPMAGLAPIRVQGCEPGCAHEWADGRTIAVGRNDADTRNVWQYENGIRKSPHPANSGGDTKTTQGAYCIHCGGWRGGLGLEPDISSYIGHLILCLREWYRILRPDGTVWCNLGDSYSSNNAEQVIMTKDRVTNGARSSTNFYARPKSNLPGKNLLMVPSRFALAAQADGWFLRSAIVWAKGVSFIPHYAGSCMPESVQDRPTQSYEMVYMLAKSPSYYYDAEAVKEQGSGKSAGNKSYKYNGIPGHETKQGILSVSDVEWNSRQLRNVWAISPRGYAGAHFACWPEALVTPMIKAGTSQHGVCAKCGSPYKRNIERTGGDTESADRPKAVGHNGYGSNTSTLSLSGNGSKEWAERGSKHTTTGWQPTCNCSCGEVIPATVLDPFVGSGTTIRAAIKLGRSAIGVDISDAYLGDLVPERTSNVQMELAL